MKYKYQIGDTVLVRQDASSTGSLNYSYKMDGFKGNVYAISGYYPINAPRVEWYTLEGCTDREDYSNWIFDVSWLELVEDNILTDINEDEFISLLSK